MSSIVREFQRDLVQSSKSTTELLRTAKLISSKLGLDDISQWVEAELTGYKAEMPQFPAYRCFSGGDLFIRNPYRGWEPVGRVQKVFRIGQAIPELEHVREAPFIFIPLSRKEHYPVGNSIGIDHSDWQQQVRLSKTELEGVLSGVKDRLLDWSLELEKRGITGEDMSFNEKERQSAQSQTFNIQNFTGVVGNVSNSTVQIYDYSSLHQVLKDRGVPQPERNELENIMDELKTATTEQKRGLLARAKAWVVQNEEFLGASASIVRKALGIDHEAGK